MFFLDSLSGASESPGGSGTQRHVLPSAKLSVLANHTQWPQELEKCKVLGASWDSMCI